MCHLDLSSGLVFTVDKVHLKKIAYVVRKPVSKIFFTNRHWSVLNKTSTMTCITFGTVCCIIYLPGEALKNGGLLQIQETSHTEESL